MPQLRYTQWVSRAALIQTRDEIFQLGDNTDCRQTGCNRIEMWMMRGEMRVPLYVEVTGQLMAAQILWEKFFEDPDMRYALRAAYGMAISRFVGGYCDTEQKGGMRESMGTVAERINLPNYFVVLRNDIAHMDLPSLVRFEQAAPEALLWLWNRHWSKLDDTNFDVRRTLFPGDHPYNEQANDPDAMVDGQDDEHNDPDAMVDDLQNAMLNPKTTQSNHATSDRKREEEISVVLNTFRTDRKKEIAAGVIKQGKKSASAIGCAALCKICCQDMDTKANTMGMIARELVKERLMIPAKRQEGDSMEGAFFMWSNLLQRMTVYEAGFLRTLLETLVGIVIAPGLVGAYQEAVAKWVVEIVMWETRGAGAKDDHRGYVLNRCLSYPRHYPRQIVVEIGDEAGGDLQEIMEELLDMSPSV